MSQVFVANGTHQHQHFFYRVVESQQLRRLEIPAGRQQKFPEDFNEGQLDSLIKQLERFGAVPVSDVTAIIHPRALVYSVHRKPIEADKIDEAREKDEVARQEVAAQQTENAGLSQFATIASHGNADAVKSTSLEVVELTDRGDDARKGGVDFEASVTRTAVKKTTGRRRGG